METIQAKVELRGNRVRVRVWTWPDRLDLLRAQLCASPQHPRAVMDLLEAVARWEGRTVHAALVADESACSYRGGPFPDLLPETPPLVHCDYVARRSRPGRDRGVLDLRGLGRDEPCLPFPACRGVGR
jgi:hypothetical protein